MLIVGIPKLQFTCIVRILNLRDIIRFLYITWEVCWRLPVTLCAVVWCDERYTDGRPCLLPERTPSHYLQSHPHDSQVIFTGCMHNNCQVQIWKKVGVCKKYFLGPHFLRIMCIFPMQGWYDRMDSEHEATQGLCPVSPQWRGEEKLWVSIIL